MKCHYEVLEVSREADNREIKSAYRKLALRWHPDKNLENPDLAKKQFQIVQQAYEVLSDTQERAWYDAHREQILHGASSEYQDNSLDVFQYFTTTCFKGYSDNDGAFYDVYRKVFDQIAKEDIEFIDEKEDLSEIPGFGCSDSSYESVKSFYDYWMSYSTKKSYSWLDPHDIREGKGDRRLLKLIEKENKKIRMKAKKERNEEVRNLAAFVRKRDKRVQAFKKEIEEKNLKNRKKHEELSKQNRLKMKQVHANEKQADWLNFDNVKSELEEIEKHLAEEFGEELSQCDDEEDNISNLYCVACNKVFKNPRSFENHELSKKHKENMEKLCGSMLKDVNDGLNDNNLEHPIKQDKGLSENFSFPEEENIPKISVEIMINSSEDEDCDDKSVQKSKSKKKRAKNIVNSPLSDKMLGNLDFAIVSDDDFDFGTCKNQKKRTRKGNVNKPKSDSHDSEQQDDEENAKNVEPNKPIVKKVNKKEKKTNRKDIEHEHLSKVDIRHCCETCSNSFPSKNKLFDHLKKTKHMTVHLPSKATKVKY